MSAKTLQGRFNARKEQFLQILKKKGVYLQFCKEQGFMYYIIIPFFGRAHRITIGIKNGFISVLKVEDCSYDRAVS